MMWSCYLFFKNTFRKYSGITLNSLQLKYNFISKDEVIISVDVAVVVSIV